MAQASEMKHEWDSTKQVYSLFSESNHVWTERQRGSKSEQSTDKLQLRERQEW